ncbi:M48 family metallopeptidase [bacterium]|nr:M48 family metallopeptidase [bacterium]
MYGFEAQIAANKLKTFGVVLGFTLFILILGYTVGEAFSPDLTYTILTGCMVFAIFGTGLGYWYSDRIITAMVGARPANPHIYRERFLIDSIEGLVLACGLPAIPKAYVIDSPAMNAFATGRDPQHSLIAVTTGLLDALDRQELEGVLAHEMSHIYNRDIMLMGVAAILVGGIAMFSHVMTRMLWYGGGGRRRDNDSGGGGALALIGIVFLILAPIFANLLNLMLSRKREFLADATAVKLTRNPEGLKNALLKISHSSEPMPEVEQELSALFIDHPQKKRSAMGGLAAMLATHPPIEARIAALERM